MEAIMLVHIHKENMTPKLVEIYVPGVNKMSIVNMRILKWLETGHTVILKLEQQPTEE